MVVMPDSEEAGVRADIHARFSDISRRLWQHGDGFWVGEENHESGAGDAVLLCTTNEEQVLDWRLPWWREA